MYGPHQDGHNALGPPGSTLSDKWKPKGHVTLSPCARACLVMPTSAGPKDKPGHPGPGQGLFTFPKVRCCLPGRGSAGESMQLCAQDTDNVCPGEGGQPQERVEENDTQLALPGRAPASSAAGPGAPSWPLSSVFLRLGPPCTAHHPIYATGCIHLPEPQFPHL